MKILNIVKDMFEKRRFLCCLLLFFAGFWIGHVLCCIAYLIGFLITS